MKWLNFLHLYQPANQQPDILESVIKESYYPLFSKLNELDEISISLNISGALFELFERNNHEELLELIKKTVKDGKVELTGSCKYHAFLPLINEDEIKRQIDQNQATLSRILGFDYTPKGFFPPEMGYHPKINKILENLGFKWLIIDEISVYKNGEFPNPNKLYKIDGTGLTVFFRNRRVSNLIMGAVARDTETLKQALQENFKEPYLVTGMDGETFGHHRLGFEKFLFEILEDRSLGITSVQNFLSSDLNLETEKVSPEPSTWASSLDDIEKGIQFLSWKDPSNTIHKMQWEFLDFALDLVNKYPKESENYAMVKHKMDMAMASDHFWWASAKPWWSLEMIEDGAFRLLDVVQSQTNVTKDNIFKAYKYYQDIVSTASAWQRQGIVRKKAIEQNETLRVPFKERTLEAGGAEEGVYWAFIDLMNNQEKVAAEKGDYEKAILWRDAVYKLENKFDIYDSINAIDLLRLEIGNGAIEKMIEKYKKDYLKIRGGQPEQRGS